MKDQFGRVINYLRVSVTDRCNLRCRYCMPDGNEVTAAEKLLTDEEIVFVCIQAVALGIDRFRITGGEPLVRTGCAALICRLREIPGLRQVALTTNGMLLAEHLEELLKAGLDAVNISLDTMDREQYRAITGRDGLERVLDAIRSAAGRLPVKVNCVIQQGINEGEAVRLAELAREMPVDVRFIELMPIGEGRNREAVPNTEVLRRIEERFGDAKEDPEIRGNGPAVYRRLDGFTGRIGFISPMHGKFCDRCNRLRLTAAGELKPCLCFGDTIPLREILRDGQAGRDERIREKIREAVKIKPIAHCFERWDSVTEKRKMVSIGG